MKEVFSKFINYFWITFNVEFVSVFGLNLGLDKETTESK